MHPFITDASLSLRDIPRLVNILRDIAPKWREIGRHLGFSFVELGSINRRSSSLHQLEEMLAMWLQWPDDRGTRTLAVLEQATGCEIFSHHYRTRGSKIPFLL